MNTVLYLEDSTVKIHYLRKAEIIIHPGTCENTELVISREDWYLLWNLGTNFKAICILNIDLKNIQISNIMVLWNKRRHEGNQWDLWKYSNNMGGFFKTFQKRTYMIFKFSGYISNIWKALLSHHNGKIHFKWTFHLNSLSVYLF